MKTAELLLQVKDRMKDIEAAEKTGDEEKVRASVEELRDFLNLAHADAEIAKARMRSLFVPRYLGPGS